MALLAFGCRGQGSTEPDAAAPSSVASGPVTVVEGPPLVELPYETDLGLVVISVEVEGVDGVVRPLRLAIDSGAPTVIQAKRVAELGLAAGDVELARDAEGKGVEAAPIVLPSLRIGELTLRNVAAISMDLEVFERFNEPLDGVLGTGLDLGTGFLDRLAVELDPHGGRVRIAQAGTSLTPGGYRLPAGRVDRGGEEEETHTRAVVEIRVGERPLWVTLDTGNNGYVDIPLGLFRELGYETDGPNIAAWQGFAAMGAGGVGESARWYGFLEQVGLGELTLPRMPVDIVGFDSDGSTDVLIGQQLIRKFILVIDLPGGEVRLIPEGDGDPSRFASTFGAGVDIRDGRVQVVALLEGSPAHMAGVEVGDTLVALDGEAVVADDPASLSRARERIDAAEQAGEGLSFDLRRGDRDLRLQLEPREPFADADQADAD